MSLKFEVFSNGQRLQQFTPRFASAMGPESVPMPGEVVFRDGLLELTRTDGHALGVSLLWELGEYGTFQLETTRLPAREQPYNLNVELARSRLMKIVQKQEDWNLFDFPRTEKYMLRFREAQQTFAEALGILDDPANASLLADRALQMAVEVSDQLSLFHADLLLNRRRATSALPKHLIGCRVDCTVQNQKYKDTLVEHFDYAILPMPWKQIQPEEGQFVTQGIDEWVDFLTKKRIPIVAGPLIDLSEHQIPDWMFIWEHDADSLREMAFDYVQKVVQRYRKHITVWNVVAGLHTNSAFTMSFEQIIELTRQLVAHVKQIHSSARTLITIQQPYGEYHAKSSNSVPPMLYAEMISQAGISFEGIGLEIVQGVPSRGGYMRDLFQISSMLDRFSTIGRPVFITGVSAPGRFNPDPGDSSEGKLDPAEAGRWKKQWDPAVQAEWSDLVYKLALSKPFVESVAWADLSDSSATVPSGGLLDDMLKPKPAMLKLQELRESLARGRK